MLHWVMAARWFTSQELTSKVRFCVLARHRSRCAEPGCENSARNAEFHVCSEDFPSARRPTCFR
jgi:hypothetical protein